ncbi:MAG: 50S ribosomal protein L17 [Patescibacteria group bacterium]
MNNLTKGRQFHRESGPRTAFIKALLTALIINGKIKTTEARAKEIRPKVEKMVTKARVKSVSNIRQIRKVLSEDVTKKLFDEISPKYENRSGGYVRITKLERRKSDGAKLAQIEFV